MRENIKRIKYITYIFKCLHVLLKLRSGKIPSIQIKNNMYFKANEYLEDSGDVPVCLVLTNVDLKLFLEQYEVDIINWDCGWKFRSMQGLFTKYIDKWIAKKNEGTITGNKGQRTIAKLMLNSLYGKFATSLEVREKMPFLGDDGIIHYELSETELKTGLYLPVRVICYSICKRKNN